MDELKIRWNSSFSVGNILLDEQHKQIINMINRLSSKSKMDVRSELISELLDKMTSYANDHFEAEEQLLEQYGYPDLAMQKEEHKEYCLKVVTLCQKAMEYNASVPNELLYYLIEWWKKHILEVDMKYKTFLEK